MKTAYQPILTDEETMEMLIAFYSEALEFLKVPKELWAELKIGVSLNTDYGKANLICINYAKRKILVCLPVLRMFIQASDKNPGETPSIYRSYGYKTARLWQQYLVTGQQRIFEKDKDSCDFALALEIIKGLPQINIPISENAIKAIGYNPIDRDAAMRILGDECGID